MKFTIRFKVPETEKEKRFAWVEPQHLSDREKLKEALGITFIKVEADDKESLAIKVVKALYTLQMFSDDCSDGQAFTLDYDLKKMLE
jgi:hypothetical protein